MQIHLDSPLSEVLWYKIGGRAKYLLVCENREDIFQALAFISDKKPNRLFICGLGSNLIFTDEYFDGAVIQIIAAKEKKDIMVTDSYLEVFSGTILDDVITYAFEHQLTGLEWAGGLPGTVGAGVRGNVGAYGGEIKDSLISAEVIDYSSNKPILKTLNNKQLQFVYRGSLVKTQKNLVIVSAKFGLKKATEEEVNSAREIYEKNKKLRREKHPLEYPNCGSVFKNLRKPEEIEKVLALFPEFKENVDKKWYGKVAVATLIERMGLKGYRVGDAQVSEKHALFIINLGKAKAKDVLKVISDIQEKFQSTFGFQLEVEAEIVQ